MPDAMFAATVGQRWHVEVVTSLDAAATLAPEWSDLVTRAACATPFQRPEWIIPWLRIFAPDRAFVLTVRTGEGRLIALLPAFRTARSRLALAGDGISDYLTPIVDESATVDSCDALCTVLKQDNFGCVFDDVPPDSPWLDATREDPDWHVEPGCLCLSAPLPGTVGAWMDALPARLRGNIRRCERRLSEDDDARYMTISREEELGDALAALFRLHGRRWQERAAQACGRVVVRAPGVLQDADVRRFHELSAPGLLASGLLRLHVLCAGPEVIAAHYVLVDRQRAYAYIAGFDPGWSRYSPGTLLMAYAMAHAIEDGCRQFDMLRGAESYKWSWGVVQRTSARVSRRGDADGG